VISRLSPGTRLGRYEIRSKLGEGGMGEVWSARDTRLNREVAIKVLPASLADDADRLRRFEQEAKAASALNHPSIVTIHEIGDWEGVRFIVMELVRGQTLRAIAKPCAVELLVNVGSQIARALSATHAAGITHRDIKPENIMLRADGYVKVLDFGVARLVPPTATDEEGATLAYRTAPGSLLGTLAYMSPEQARGLPVTAATDIFALGVVFYELATGRHPFKADSMIGILHAITSQTPVRVSRLNTEVPAPLDVLIMRMLEKDANLRPKAVEIDKALSELAGVSSGGHFQRSIKVALERPTVGRKRERTELRKGFESVLEGRGLLLCVAGEPGIGKTTLVEDFLTELSAEGRCMIARGRCSERLAGTEAYLPLLEALESLLQDGSNPAASRVMRQIAPTWYAQVASLSIESEESARVLNEVKGASQERMKRELGAFSQEVSRLRPLVLFFDDLHWADISTIDLLNFLATRFDALSVLVIVTYRPSDMLLAKHPFLQIKPDLQARGLCRELQLEFLNREEIAEYLALEFPGHRFPPEFPKLIHAKTEGNPLFMADVVRYLLDRNVIARADGDWALVQDLPDIERELPESVRGMIERKIAQLSEEDRKLLVTASVQGYEFDSAVIAQVVSIDAGEVEERLENLERIHAFVGLVEDREFPDRTLSLRYRFVHVLYQNVLYASLRATRKVQMNSAVARALEGFFGEQRASVAGELAALYEAAREYAQAAECFRLAAHQSSQVSASQEAIQLARRGLAMSEMLQDGRERCEHELSLQVVLGNALMATLGYAAPETEQTWSRARSLCQQLDDTPYLFPVLYGLCAFYITRGKHRKALEVGKEFLDLAEREQDPAIVVAHRTVGSPLLYLGEVATARMHFEQIVSLYTPAQHRFLTWLYGHEPGVIVRDNLAWALWLLGHPELALKRSQEALQLGREVSHSNSLALTLGFVAIYYQFRRERRQVLELVEEMLVHCFINDYTIR